MAGNIVLTGGRLKMSGVSAQTYVMDLKTDRWLKKSFPKLNKARSEHSALGIGEQCYIACGWGRRSYLNSVEMLRRGAEAWELIDIPDLKPR